MAKKTQRFDPRQNMNGNTYEVFHYLDLCTRHLDAHYHDFYEIFCFIDGDVDYWVDGRFYHLQSGDLLLIHPSELHKPSPRSKEDRYERIVLWLDPAYLADLGEGALMDCFDPASPRCRKMLRPSSAEKNQLLTLFQQMAQEYNGDAFGKELCTYGLLLQTMTLINRIAGRPQKIQEKYSTPTLIADILAYIGAHYHENLSLDCLSAHFFINKYYLSHEFKKAVGTGVHRYITLKRLSVAYRLLSEGGTPNEVSALCGFGDYTSFFRAFKAEYGISPAALKP